MRVALQERDAWILLASVDGVGEQTFGRLLARHGSASRVLALARAATLPADLAPDGRSGPRLHHEVHERIGDVARDAQQFLAMLDALDVWTVTALDDAYPTRLRVLDPPPPVIYGWGSTDALRWPRSIAIVGTRHPTPHGRATAAAIAMRLVESGASIVSGLAVGIDGAAQASAVEHEGISVGVLGSGHGDPGPRAHRALVREIVRRRGAVISELAPDARATRGTFPRRNRLISALADAVVVVEAPVRSGALITARHGLEQGRDVFAVPGRLGDEASAGCLALIRETPARIVVGIDQLLADVSHLPRPAGAVDAAGEQPEAHVDRPKLTRSDALALLGSPERSIAGAICDAPIGIDGLVARTGFPPGTVAAAITLLQLRGWVQQIGGTYLPAGALLG